MSRRRCSQEGAAPPPSLRRLRSTPPVSLRSVRRVPACRASRSVPPAPGLRAPPDRSPCHRRARAIGIDRRRSGSRPRPVRHARAERHSEVLPPQSCRSRRERSGADLASRPRRRHGMLPAGGSLASVASSSPRALIAMARLLRFDGGRPQALHRVPSFGDRLRRMFNRAIQLLFRLGRAVRQQVRRGLEPQQQAVEALQQRVVQLPRDACALGDAFVEASAGPTRDLTRAGPDSPAHISPMNNVTQSAGTSSSGSTPARSRSRARARSRSTRHCCWRRRRESGRRPAADSNTSPCDR